jgi:hypothetical protein
MTASSYMWADDSVCRVAERSKMEEEKTTQKLTTIISSPLFPSQSPNSEFKMIFYLYIDLNRTIFLNHEKY